MSLDDVDVTVALIDALLAQIDAVQAAMQRTSSAAAKDALREKRALLEVELEAERAKLADEPRTSPVRNPFAPSTRDDDSSSPDTIETKKESSTNSRSSEDSERLVVFARAKNQGLAADSLVKAAAGLERLNGAPAEIRVVADVLCAAVGPVNVKSLAMATNQSVEKLLPTLRRLVLIKLVELC